MEFEDMQVIWNSQEQEKQYVINESVLHKFIQDKSRSVNRLIGKSELFMIGVNLLVGLFLLADTIIDKEAPFQYVLPVVYLLYSVIVGVSRIKRRQAEEKFEPSIVGELDKAIWQITGFIKQSRSIFVWYLLPLLSLAFVSILLDSGAVWSLILVVALIPATYFGSRWEVNKYYVPKKQELETLREKILAPVAEEN